MYLPNSTKAAEFLCHEEVMQTLAYAQENKNNLPMIQEILAKARLQKGLTHREASVLLACPSETVWEELYQLAEAINWTTTASESYYLLRSIFPTTA